jgi:hypothetical protein
MLSVRACLIVWVATLLAGCRSAPDFGFPMQDLPHRHTSISTEYGALPIDDNQMIWVKNKTETALIQFTKFDGDHAFYRYRLHNYATGTETRGTGEVFEKLEVIERVGKNTKVRDAGSQTHLKPGTFDIGWSKGSNRMGWIYLNRSDWDLRVVRATEFETYRYQKVRRVTFDDKD